MISTPAMPGTADVMPTPATNGPLDAPDQEDESQELDRTFQKQNLAENLDEDELVKIGTMCRDGFENDLKTRDEWDRAMSEWVNLARQQRETKSYPWPKASNVKYPLLTTAAMQFAARAYPSLLPSDGKIIKAQVIGKDPTGEKADKAERVSLYMSYQVMNEVPNWEQDMDKMLMQLPIVGTMFKKTWYDPAEDKIQSKLILPQNIIVNYWTKCIDEAERISEIIEISPRLLKERQLQGLYLDVDLGTPSAPESPSYSSGRNDYATVDDTTPYELVEQHTFYDEDEDGYSEPYIVLFERRSGTVLRISRRYRKDDVQFKEDGKTITKIKPQNYYTKFGFVPNPDGSFYDIGFGVLLGPLNESVNTLINQLIDAGSLSNLQSGFIGKALRLKMGDAKFAPGEWKPVNATGDDLRKQIVPLPAKDPSNTLFELMGQLVTSGKELASVAEIFVGKMPGQNTPATTTMASIEQGMKVFTAVYKRLYRALKEEFEKIFTLNRIYIDPNHYTAVIDTAVGPDDFDDDNFDIVPGADPTAVSQTEKLLKAQGLIELLPQIPGMLDPIEVFSRVLQAQEQPNWQKLFSKEVQQSGQLPPPQPDPKAMAIQAKSQADQQLLATKQQAMQQNMELEGRDRMMQMAMDQQEHQQNMQFKAAEAAQKGASEIAKANINLATEHAKSVQTIVNNQQSHQQKMAAAKEQQKLQTSTSKTGNASKKH